MGQGSSSPEKPDPKFDATLYYFAGRGVADQIRWLLAASNISFTQKVISSRTQYLKMTERQLPFGQLPLLQIDGIEIVQTQAILRYLARRANLTGETPAEEMKCEVLVETIRDLVTAITAAPFHRFRSKTDADIYKTILKEKWLFLGERFEFVLKSNGGKFLVGKKLTYADVLLVHILTWFVEECGPQIVETMPYLVDLQYRILEIESVNRFIRSNKYYPLGDDAYCTQVQLVLGRER